MHKPADGQTDGSVGLDTFVRSATARVLGIPELLENVLLEVSKSTAMMHENPATKLFVLQRVSKSFEIAIRTSPALRRRMWLAPLNASTPATSASNMHYCCDQTDCSYRSHFAGIEWLCRKLGKWSGLMVHIQEEEVSYQLADDVRAGKIFSAPEQNRLCNARMLVPNATWRNMMCIPVTNAAEFRLNFRFRIGGWDYDDDDQYYEYIHSNGTVEVGVVFDSYRLKALRPEGSPYHPYHFVR